MIEVGLTIALEGWRAMQLFTSVSLYCFRLGKKFTLLIP